MFAVPGWSVSADSLKAETTPKDSGTSVSKTKKRKRGGAAREQVTSSNVADLFESMVDGKKNEAPKTEKATKRQKKSDQDGGDNGQKKQDEKPSPESHETASEMKKDKKNKKEKKKQKKAAQTEDSAKKSDSSPAKPTSDNAANAPPPLPPAPPKLTPLQASMRQKLVSARFRHLNETLYTRPSEEAYSLFQDSPEMFDEYHEGFRQQVKVWPENPVDSFLADIRHRGKIRVPPGKGSSGGKNASGALPRTAGTCTIADLGCGDARLAESLQPDKKKFRLQVHSYDLQSPSPLVTKADIANLPLDDGSVNVAIFCLALMGTNWVDFVEEAYRILHWKGELWVAEIKSRFAPVRSKNSPVAHSVGNRKTAGAGKKGKGGGKDDADGLDFEEDLAIEVDGADDRRRETDVSAFVEVLRKRGFILQGERNEAIDLSNKMFVKMRFIKGSTPTKGKGVRAQEPGKVGKKGMPGGELGKDEDDKLDANEASILKPCVYKIR